MKSKRLYISALWLVEGNLKRSPEHYFHHLEPTLKMIRGGNLMFFYESEDILNRVSAVAKNYDINLLPFELKLEDHPDLERSKAMAQNSCEFRMDVFADAFPDLISNEKGFNQYFKFLNRGENVQAYSKQLVCTIGKYSLIQKSMEKYDFEELYWVDVSASRFNHARKNFDFCEIPIRKDAIHHYSSSQKIFGQTQKVQGSVLFGNRKAWESFAALYDETFRAYIDSGCTYPATDEPLMTLCHLKNPDLFERVDSEERTLLHKAVGKLLSPLRRSLLIAMNQY
jgi:hypothetical protein